LKKAILTICIIAGFLTLARAEEERSTQMVPNGKGWGVRPVGASGNKSGDVVTGNGVNYHGGPVMHANVNVYFIWYGNWANGPKPSDSPATVGLLNKLFAASGGMGNSGFYKINTTYADTTAYASGNVVAKAATADAYSHGKNIADADVQAIVARAIANGSLPKDVNGIYFVLTSSDVNETSGFCTQYCGWHNHAAISGQDIKFAFVGNPDRCQSACEAQTVTPNGDSGADGMASVMAHESSETITDPDFTGWYDSAGNEIGDKCAWKFGPYVSTTAHGVYNQTFGANHWLIQMLWEDSRGGGCDQTLGGTFYKQ